MKELLQKVNFMRPPVITPLKRCQNPYTGADRSCKGSARLGTVSRNSQSVDQYGIKLADSLQQWLEDDLACGPLTKEKVEEPGPPAQ